MLVCLNRNAKKILWSLSRLLTTRMSTNCSDITGKTANITDTGSTDVTNNDGRDHLIWIDCEMTGLEVEKCYLLEVACIITDDKLNVIAKGPNIVINQPDAVLDSMNEWCTDHHGQSGLMQKSRDSLISVSDAESELLQFVRTYTPPSSCPLAGNSVHVDKVFLSRYMPEFVRHLHYRIVDVSTIKELCRRWYPTEYRMAPQKMSTHRALDDIEESIKELKFYRQVIFKASV